MRSRKVERLVIVFLISEDPAHHMRSTLKDSCVDGHHAFPVIQVDFVDVCDDRCVDGSECADRVKYGCITEKDSYRISQK